MDISDQATFVEERDRALAIAKARVRADTEPVACGVCHNCEAPLPEGLRFCDADCRDDWVARRRAGLP